MLANFYASRDYLDAAAAVWFKGRHVEVENVQFGRDVLRLLVVDGRVISRLTFLDYHEPLAPDEIEGPVRQGGHARNVVRGIIPLGGSEPNPEHHLAPFVDWRGFASIGDYREALLGRHRSLVRDRERRGRSLAKDHGEITFTVDDRADDVLPAARAWKSAQLQATGQKDFFARPETGEFLALLRERELLVCSTLRAGGRLVSLWLGFIHQGVWSGWIFTYDPAFRKYSAGHQLLNAMLEESFARGHAEFDFSEGGEDYKMIYATHARLLGEVGTPPLTRATVTFAKRTLRGLDPRLLEAAQSFKRAFAMSLVGTKTQLGKAEPGLPLGCAKIGESGT